jgi:hypothetical protein
MTTQTLKRSAAVGRTYADRIFYTAVAGVVAAIVFAGFGPTFYLRTSSQLPLSMLLTIHGVLFTSWIVLLIMQTSFIAAGRRDVHKRVGIAGIVLGAAMIALAVLAAVDALRRGAAPLPGVDPRTFLIIPLGDAGLFAGFLGAGFYYRRSPETHKRLMIVATLSLLGAAFGRMIPRLGVGFLIRGGPLSIFGLVLLLVAACAAYDFAMRRRVHPVYVWGGIAIALSVPVRLLVGTTTVWLAFADRLLR